MRISVISGTTIVALLLMVAGCTTVHIPPEQAVWAASVKQQIAQATASHYVYIPVADKQQMQLVEDLAFQQCKSAQRIKSEGKLMECVFVSPF